MEGAENSLSFFTTNHSNHDSQWRMTGTNISVVCVACLVELLENPEVLHLRKRKALREVVFLLSNSQHLLELLSQNTRITSHLCGTIMDLLSSDNELLVNTAIEALDLTTVKLRSEFLVEEIVAKLQTQILQVNNLKKSYPFVLTLGRLLKSIPALSLVIAKDSPQLIEYFLSNILFPEDKIKAALLFVLVQICSKEEVLNTLSFQVMEKICKQTCALVACSVSTEVQTNALGVLRLLSMQSDVLNSALKSDNKGSCALLESLKKLMLSPNEAIQIGAIQCVTQMLRNDSVDSTFTKIFLTSGICEMLLEDLESSNDIVLGSVFCSLDHLVRTQIFYSEGYSVYGIESVIVGVSKAIKLKNLEIIKQGVRVLSLILSMQPCSIQLFPSEELCRQCANVLLESLKSPDHRVLIQATCAVEHFLSIFHHPPSMEFEVVVPLVSAVISHLQKFMKPRIHFRNVSKGSLETFLCALLRVIKKAFQFVKEYQEKEPSYAALLTRNDDSITTENDSLNQFLESLWKSIDQICVPAVMLNYESVENPAVFTNIFDIIHLSVSSESSCRESFAQKLASGSFMRLSLEIREKFCQRAESRELTDAIACFVAELCLALGNATERNQLSDRLTKGNIDCIHSPSACLNLLVQSSIRQDTSEIVDESLFSTQCCCIELIYASFSHGDEIVPIEELAAGLHKYLVLHPDLSILPRVTLKHLLFLYITSCNRLKSSPPPPTAVESINISQRILEQNLIKFKAEEFEDIYIHDVLFVSWIFSSETLAQTFGRQVFICFMETEGRQNFSNHKALHNVLSSNFPSFRTFVSLVDYSEETIVNGVVAVLEALIAEVSGSDKNSDSFSDTSKPRLSALANHFANIFHKLFISHKSNPLPGHSIVAMLQVMTVVQMNFPAFDIKLLYHVVSLLTSANNGKRFTKAAINYLNVTLAWDLGIGDHNNRVAAILLSNKAFCEFIQEILDAKQVNNAGRRDISMDDANLLAIALVLVSSLAILQPQCHTDGHDAFKVNKKGMINLANERRNALVLSSLVFWDVFFKTSSGRSNKPLVVLYDRIQDQGRYLELSDVDVQVLHVFLQNSLVHDSETVRQCAVKCLGSFLSHVPDATSFASNPWNRIVFESQLSVLSVNVITSSLVLFSQLILQHAPKRHQFTRVLQNVVKSILDRIPSISCLEEDLSWHCINLLVQLLSSEDNILSQNQKGAVATWLATFKGSLTARAVQSGDSKEDFKFFIVDDVIFAKDLLKAKVPADPELLTKATLLVGDKIDDE